MTTPKNRKILLQTTADRASVLSDMYRMYYIVAGGRTRQWRELGHVSGGTETGEKMAILGRKLIREISSLSDLKYPDVKDKRTTAAYRAAEKYTLEINKILDIAEAALFETRRNFNGEKQRLIGQPPKQKPRPPQFRPQIRIARPPAEKPSEALADILKNNRRHVDAATLYEKILEKNPEAVTPQMVAQARYSMAQSRGLA